jgi:hypothetical protein
VCCAGSVTGSLDRLVEKEHLKQELRFSLQCTKDLVHGLHHLVEVALESFPEGSRRRRHKQMFLLERAVVRCSP